MSLSSSLSISPSQKSILLFMICLLGSVLPPSPPRFLPLEQQFGVGAHLSSLTPAIFLISSFRSSFSKSILKSSSFLSPSPLCSISRTEQFGVGAHLSFSTPTPCFVVSLKSLKFVFFSVVVFSSSLLSSPSPWRMLLVLPFTPKADGSSCSPLTPPWFSALSSCSVFSFSFCLLLFLAASWLSPNISL